MSYSHNLGFDDKQSYIQDGLRPCSNQGPPTRASCSNPSGHFDSPDNVRRIISKKLPPKNLVEVLAVLNYLETANARAIRDLFKRIGCPRGRYFGAPVPLYPNGDDLIMVCFYHLCYFVSVY